MEPSESPSANQSSEGEGRPSTSEEIDRALDILAARKDAWISLALDERIALLDKVRLDLKKNEGRLIGLSLQAKGTQGDEMGEAEEWAALAVIYRQIRLLGRALRDMVRYGAPVIPGKITTRENGQLVAQVVPIDWKEKLALPGMRAEVWMDPSVTVDDGIPQASPYHDRNRKGQVCTILAAGNFSSLVTGDLLHKLFVDRCVVALKMNSVNSYLGPVFKDVFSSLIEQGFVQVLYGTANEGALMYNNPAVDCLHMTGTDRTYEAIVFGAGDEGLRRKQSRQPVFTKPFTAELGNISPVIIVPGPWTEVDIKNQAKRLASWLMPNAGYACLTPRMLIQMKSWEYRQQLIEEISRFMAAIRTRKAYYPGSFEIHEKFLKAHPDAMQCGSPNQGHLPWTFIPDVEADNREEICFNTEPFASLFSETSLAANDVVDYIAKAVQFVNERLWGTLVASIVVHPKSLKDPIISAAVDDAIADLRYGTVVVNNWGYIAYYFGNTLWGAYPGSDIYDIQSGTGTVNNPLMFDRRQKSVCYADFSPVADPVIASNLNARQYFQQEAQYQFDPSMGNMFKAIWRAMMLKDAG